jgi:hypothetical protein
MKCRALTSNTTSRVISEELQVKECALAARPAAQHLLPATLLLEAVGKSDVDVLQREVILGKLLETQNDSILGGILDPGTFRDERSTDLDDETVFRMNSSEIWIIGQEEQVVP